MLVDPKELWERRYSRMRSAGIRPNGDPWLARWRAQLEVAELKRIRVRSAPLNF